MAAVVKAVGNVIEDVAEAIGDAVEDVVEAVGTAVETVVKNPEILLIAVAAPYALPAIGITGVAVAPVTAGLITASQGGDLEDIGKSMLAAYIAPQVAGKVATTASSAGLQSSLANAVGGAAGGATAAAVTGGDIGKSALSSGIASGVGAEAKEFGVEQGLTPATAESIARVVGATAGGAAAGDAEAAATSALLGELNRELRRLSQKEIDIGFGEGKFTKDLTEADVAGMPEEQFNRMMDALESDLSAAEREELQAFGPQDYGLTAGTTRTEAEGMGGAQGLRGRLGALREREDGGVDYESVFEGEFGGEGLRVPSVPGAEGMGGGTGLTVPREGETVTERGPVPEDQILRQIQEEMYPTPSFGEEEVTREPTDLSTLSVRRVGESPLMGLARGETPAISTRVTGEAGAAILGEKEPLFGGDEDQQRAVWNRRSLRLRRALGL